MRQAAASKGRHTAAVAVQRAAEAELAGADAQQNAARARLAAMRWQQEADTAWQAASEAEQKARITDRVAVEARQCALEAERACAEAARKLQQEAEADAQLFQQLTARAASSCNVKRTRLLPTHHVSTHELQDGLGLPIVQVDLNGNLACNSSHAMSEGSQGIGADVDASVSECVVCWAASSEVLFQPCGHLCTCAACARSFSPENGRACPLCRHPITSAFSVSL